MQAGVVEEVVVLPLPSGPVRQHLHDSRRNGLPRELVVDDHGEPALLARHYESGHVNLERRVAALVVADAGVPDPHGGAVRGGVESEDDALSGPAARDEGVALVPDVTDMVVHLRIGQHVVEAARHRHPTTFGEGGAEPTLGATDPGTVRAEGPDPVEPLGLAGAAVLWSKHVVSRFVGQVSAGLPASSPMTSSAIVCRGAAVSVDGGGRHLFVEVRPRRRHGGQGLSGLVPEEGSVIPGPDPSRQCRRAGPQPDDEVAGEGGAHGADRARHPRGLPVPRACRRAGLAARPPIRGGGRRLRRPPPRGRGRSCPSPGR